MRVARYKKKAVLSDTSNKNGTQQRKHPLMPFGNKGTLLKGHMTNRPPKTDKYDNIRKKGCLTKLTHLAKNFPKVTCQGLN